MQPFQAEGVKAGLRFGGRLLLGDEMGLGKTLQSIAIACAYKDDWPLLVCCPSSLRSQWGLELLTWTYMNKSEVFVVQSGKQLTARLQGEGLPAVTVVTYDLLMRAAQSSERGQLSQLGVVIADECHALKNCDAQRTKALTPLFQNAKRCIMLTGTPALNRPAELHSLLQILRPEYQKVPYREFGKRYCDGKVFPAAGCDTAGLLLLLLLLLLLPGVC